MTFLNPSRGFINENRLTSGNQGDSDKAKFGFKIYKISIITIRITYHQINVDINPWS